MDGSIPGTWPATARPSGDGSAWQPRPGRVVGRYLPAYATLMNPIERVRHLHEKVTGNYRCPTMTELLSLVRDGLANDSRFPIETTAHAELRIAAKPLSDERGVI